MTDLWSNERRLWLEGVDAYAELMAGECTMVFGPVGILGRQAILDSLRDAPRWDEVSLSAQVRAVHGQRTVVLAYRVSASRDAEGDAYNALCSSTYVFENSQWRLAQHQQTPV